MRWSNDAFISTKHRVVDKVSEHENTVKERYSVALFVHPDDDVEGEKKKMIF